MAKVMTRDKQTSSSPAKVTTRYNQSKVYGWQAQNKSALDLLNEYYNRINAGEWLSNEDRAKYKSAIDTYTTTGNALRDVSKFYGTKYTDEEEKSWQDSLSSLNKGYTSANDFYNQFASDKVYNDWREGQKRNEDYQSKLTNIDVNKATQGWEKYQAENQPKKFGYDEAIMQGFSTMNDNPFITLFNQSVYNYRNDDSHRRPNDNWTQEQRNAFGQLYLENPAKAFQFAEETNNRNNKAQEEAKLNSIKSMATDNFGSGVLHTLGSLGGSLFALGDVLDDAAKLSAGRDINKYNNYDGFVTPNEYSQAVQGGITEKLNEIGTIDDNVWMFGGKGLGDAYALGTSIIQSMAYGGVAKAMGSGAVSLIGYFGQAAAQGMDDAIERGADGRTALLYGTLMGAVEAGAEQIGIDNLLKTGNASSFKGVLKNILKQSGAEALEEGITSIASSAVDNWLMGDHSNFAYDYAALRNQGYSESDAKKRAWANSVGTVLFDTLAGGISGGISGGIYNTAGTAIDRTVKGVGAKMAYGNNAGAMATNALLEISPNDAYGQKMQTKLGEGKNLSAYQVGKTMEREAIATHNYDVGQVKSAVSDRLTELGERGNVAKISDAIAREQAGEELSLGEKNLIKKSDFGKSVRAELNPETLKSDTEMNRWAESIGTRRLNSDVYSKRPPSVKVQTNEGKSAEIGSIKAVEGDVATVELSDGTVAKVGLGKNTQSEVKFNDAKTEEMFKIATERIGKVEGWTVESANAMVTAFEHSSNGLGVSDFTRAWSEAYNIGRNNNSRAQLNHSSYATLLDEATRSNAYNIGKAIYSETRTREQAPTRTTMPISTDTNENISRANIEVKTNDGARARIDAIKSINNDIVTVELNNGKEARIGLGKNEQRDVTFSNPQTEQIFKIATERIGKVEGWTSETASAMINAYNGQNIVAGKFAKGWQAAYNIGRNNNSIAQLNSSPLAMELDAQTRADAYNIGKAIAMTPATVSPNAKYSVTFDETIDTSTFNKKQKNDIKALEIVSKALGVNVKVFDSPVNAKGERIGKNGSYNPTTRTIEVDLHAGNHGEGIINLTSAHEVTHHMKVVARDQFNNYADAVFETLGEDGKVLIANKLEQLSRNGHLEGMTEEEAYDLAFEEVVADSSERMFVDTDALVKLAETLKKKDKTLWEKFRDGVVNILNKLKKAYAELNPQSEAAQTLMNAQDKLEKIQKLWVEGVVAAAEVSDQVQTELGIEIDTATESVSPTLMSERTWTESEYVVNRDAMAKKIASALNISERKAKKYIDDVNSIARIIANDRARLDYQASSFGSAFVSNVEYGGSFDYTTLCKKRRLYTGTFSEIQKRLHDVALTPDEILTVRNMLIEAHKEATCGLCYVEGSRANMGKFAQKFIELYKRDNPDGWSPNMADVNTPDGVEQMRINHPEAYEQYEYFWNHYGKLQDSDPALFASQQKPKLYEARKEYKGEILTHFKADNTITKKNLNGGVRMQSFSDFEVIHLIDTMQVIMDMSTVGLAGQAYTKVPEFALAFGNTGLKINLSLIAKGVDENGKLIFDDREGMPHETAFDIRNKYSKNVGTIIVTFTDEQLLAAMADERIDYIIPFHRSQWKKGQYNAMGLPKGTKDYTYMQNEKLIKKTYHEYRGKMVADKATNYMPNEYWDFSKSGKENAEAYLKMCAENNKRPKFYKLLDYDGVGTYSLKADGSTDGYWKLLIDFKMYDNDGVGSPQTSVAPIFNMDEATKMMEEYKGGHEQYPIAHDVVDKFVEQYNKDKGTKYSDRTTETNQDRLSDEESFSNRSILANALASTVQHEVEQKKLDEYRSRIAMLDAEEAKLSKLKAEIKELTFGEKRDPARLKEIKEEARKTEARIDLHDKKLLQLESTTALKNVLERARKESYAKAMQKGKELMHKNVEGRRTSEIRNKIRKYKDNLIKTIEHPTERKYIPIDLVKSMIDVVDLIDTDTDLYKKNGEINKAQEKRNATKERLQKLRSEYENLKTNKDPLYAGEFDEAIYDYIKELQDNYSDKSINDMSLIELTEMYEILQAINETLLDARKLIGWTEGTTVIEAGDTIVAEQDEIRKARKDGKRNTAAKVKDAAIDLSLSPVRNVERMSGYNDDSPLVKLFHGFVEGVRKKNFFIMTSYRMFEKLTTGENQTVFEDARYKEFGEEMTDSQGRKFKVSKMQMMQAILSYERETANNQHHIEYGGFTFANLKLLSKGNIQQAISSENSHRVGNGEFIVHSFIKQLAGDKWCQDYMKMARKFFNENAKDAVNEATIALKHRIVARGSKYIPFEVDKNFVVLEITEDSIQQTISSYGMLKDVNKQSAQPLIMTGLDNVIDRHIEQVGNIYGLAVPIRNFNKVWNVHSHTETLGGSGSVKDAVEAAWGKSGTKVITQTVRDLQGSRTVDNPDVYNAYSAIKGNVIGATFKLNLSVVTKQIGSLFTATSMLDWRNPASMLINLLDTMKNHDTISAEVDKYTATAWMRRQGLSDAELHTLATEGQKSKLKRWSNKLPTAISPDKWITGMDSMVALSLWKYAKEDVAKRTNLKGEALLKETAKFYDELVENTQSMSDVLHRPEVQRSKNILLETLSMFKTDLYQMAGQLQGAYGRYQANNSEENGKALAKTVGSVLMSTMWGTLMTTLWALVRYKVNPYRDDEDDELTIESWLSRQGVAVVADLVGYVVPLFGSEAVGIIERIWTGETEDVADSLVLSAVNDVVSAIEGVANSAVEGEFPKEEAFRGLLTKVCSLFGVPMSNILRIIEAIKLHGEDIANKEFLSFEAGLTRPNSTRLYNAYIERDPVKIEKASRHYEDQKEIESALRKAIRENDPRVEQAAKARLDGDNDTYYNLMYDVIGEGNFDSKLIKDAFKAEYEYLKDKKKEAEAKK